MKLKSMSVPRLLGNAKKNFTSLYTMLVNAFSRTQTVVNNNENMSCSRLRSFIGS